MKINNETFLSRDSAWFRLADNTKLFNDLIASLADETYPPMKLIHVDLFVTQPTCCPVEGQLPSVAATFPMACEALQGELNKIFIQRSASKAESENFPFFFSPRSKVLTFSPFANSRVPQLV